MNDLKIKVCCVMLLCVASESSPPAPPLHTTHSFASTHPQGKKIRVNVSQRPQKPEGAAGGKKADAGATKTPAQAAREALIRTKMLEYASCA